MFNKLILAFSLTLGITMTASADEVSDFLKEADKAYKNGHYSTSMQHLEAAMNLIKDVQATKIGQYFPAPLDGWQQNNSGNSADSPIPNVQLGMLSTIIRRYEKKPESALSINLLASDQAKAKTAKNKQPWVQFTLLQKPNSLIKMGYQGMHALRASNPEAKTITLDGYEGVLYCDAKQPKCDVFFDFDGNFLLMVNAENASEADVKAYTLAFDAKGLIDAN